MVKKSIQRGYTLIEMIMVVILLGILISLGVNYISTIDTERYNSESCVNTLYGPLSQRVYYASTSRVLSGDIIPQDYLIQKEQNSGFILRYNDQNGEHTYQTGLLSDISYCQKGSKYMVSAFFTFDQIKMLPGLMPQGNQNGFEIIKEDNLMATGSIILKLCSPALENICQDFGEIIFDARTAMIKKRFCKLYYPQDENDPLAEKKCREWNTGT